MAYKMKCFHTHTPLEEPGAGRSMQVPQVGGEQGVCPLSRPTPQAVTSAFRVRLRGKLHSGARAGFGARSTLQDVRTLASILTPS